MKLASLEIFRFELPLKRPLALKSATITSRTGLALRLEDDSGNIGWGETSPLPAFSREDIDIAARQLMDVGSSLTALPVTDDLEKLNGRFDFALAGFSLAPSVRFGLESAVLNLLASARKVSLPQLLGGGKRAAVTVNGLLVGEDDEILQQASALKQKGYNAFKLKVGRRPVQADISLTEKVRRAIGDSASLRLDANRAWDVVEAHAFMVGVSLLDIQYIEEPARNLDQLRKLLYKTTPPVPVALDESLLELAPEDLASPYPVKAVVVKPTLLGLERAACFARSAREHGITAVISSSFESSLGLYTLAALSEALNQSGVACGLDTLDWFAQDLCREPVRLESGLIDLKRHIKTPVSVNTDLLKEIRGE
ncbi:MAG: o-succinylbenzoate synthase [Candidatus Zixiibacteriota bacterium]|nr:MAG: o-succinylbenzoate synthase [candidate division Zixibacteria bacterium]